MNRINCLLLGVVSQVVAVKFSRDARLPDLVLHTCHHVTDLLGWMQLKAKPISDQSTLFSRTATRSIQSTGYGLDFPIILTFFGRHF